MAAAHPSRRRSPGGRSAPTEAHLEACRRRDPAALEALCAGSVDTVYRWAVFLGLPPADAEDVTQRVLMIATDRIATFDGAGALDAWLYQITRRVIANHRRSSWWRRWWSRGAAVEPAFAERGHDDLELEASVREALARLPARLAEVLVLTDIEERSRSEVAAMLGVAEGTVASRVRQARAAFVELWRGAPEGEVPRGR